MMVGEYIDHKRCSECEGTFINSVNIVLPSVLLRVRRYLPANISSNSYRTAEECKESTLPTSRAPSCESGIEGIASAAKDMIVRFSPLTFERKRKCRVMSKCHSCRKVHQNRTINVCGTFVRTKGTAPHSYKIWTRTES